MSTVIRGRLIGVFVLVLLISVPWGVQMGFQLRRQLFVGTEPLVIDNSIHPVNRRVALARAIRSVLSVFDLRMNDVSGRNNGHFAPFSWQSDGAV